MTDSISAVRQVLNARAATAQAEKNVVVAEKQLESLENQGDVAIQLVRQAVEVQRQLTEGYLDVRV